MPGTTLGPGDIAMNKTKFPIFMGILAKALENCGPQTNLAHCMFLSNCIETWPHSIIYILPMTELSILFFTV